MTQQGFRAVLFRMVPKPLKVSTIYFAVLELCCFEWFQNADAYLKIVGVVLELCCFEWFQNTASVSE